jgi:hypothetical protein
MPIIIPNDLNTITKGKSRDINSNLGSLKPSLNVLIIDKGNNAK